MITSVRLQNFKGHSDTTVNLGRLTLLVGPNGAGKTSVLQAIHSVSRLLLSPASSIFRDGLDPFDIHRRSSDGPTTLTVRGLHEDVAWNLSIQIELKQPPNTDWSLMAAWSYGEEAGEKVSTRNLEQVAPNALKTALGSAALYYFDTRKIAAVASTDDVNPAVQESGEDTAAVLASLKLEHEEIFERIQSALKAVVPNVQKIRVRRVRVGTSRVGHRIHIDLHGAPDVPAHVASEGTLITLALLTVLFSPDGPMVVLLDDLDHALHPEAQIELIRQLKRLLEEMPDLQIVATTHSPYLLDELSPDDIQVFALRKDGSVATKRLSEHPQAQVATSLTAGQLWSLDPERRWVAEED